MQEAEVEDDDDADEALEQHQEFPLCREVGFAGLVNQLGNFEHRPVYGHVLQPHINDQAENHAQHAKKQTEHQQAAAADAAQKRNTIQVRQVQIGLASLFGLGHQGNGRQSHPHQGENSADRAE